MKISKYKCDVCGKVLTNPPQGHLMNVNISFGGAKWIDNQSAVLSVETKVKNLVGDDPNNVDICHTCVKRALLDKIQSDLNPF